MSSIQELQKAVDDARERRVKAVKDMKPGDAKKIVADQSLAEARANLAQAEAKVKAEARDKAKVEKKATARAKALAAKSGE